MAPPDRRAAPEADWRYPVASQPAGVERVAAMISRRQRHCSAWAAGGVKGLAE